MPNMHRIVPPTIMTRKGVSQVVKAVAYPPGHHPKACAIKPEYTVVEVHAANGLSRQFGFLNAFINGGLGMQIECDNPRFEEVAAWPPALPFRPHSAPRGKRHDDTEGKR